jgi:ankyrin repeat protein
MYYASRDGKNKVCQFLINQDLNVNDIDVYGQNPIYYAVAYGNMETCKFLQRNGSFHDYVDENGETPLYYTIKHNRETIAEWLITLGCNLNI